MKIIICCNKNDFFLTRICIGSIRYYYPENEIFIVKDILNGEFETNETEKAWNVKVLDLGISKFGWSAAKMHLLLSNVFPGEKLLVLDSDIVFAGKFLEKVFNQKEDYDFAVDATEASDPYTDYVYSHYYNIDYIKSLYPEFQFPGYFFNGGQMVITTGKLKHPDVAPFFDMNTFPFWKQLDKLPFVDQSLLNFFLPLKEQQGEIKILKTHFMQWSETKEFKELQLEKIKSGELNYLVHWAGAVRIPYLSKMTRPDVLSFFEKYYYKKIPFGNAKMMFRKIMPVIMYYSRWIYHSFKNQNK